jgi:Bacterial pre-peptidase C-terminal domain
MRGLAHGCAALAILLGGSAALAQSPSPSFVGHGSDDLRAIEARDWPLLSIGQIDGSLTTSDYIRKDGSYVDPYYYNAQAGETVTITMRSSDFDAWLVVDDPNGSTNVFNDDAGGGTDAQITITFPHAGRYLVLANVVNPQKTGQYTLAVSRNNGSAASTASDTEIAGQFRKADDLYAQKGYSPASLVQTGSIASSGSDRISIHLTGRASSSIIGFCNNACSDLDLQLVDSTGHVVDEDTKDDDYPVLMVHDLSGDYQVIVHMKKCGDSPCRYGIKLYTK